MSQALAILPASRRSEYLGAALVTVQAAAPAALWTIALWGRAAPATVSRQWAATFLAAGIGVVFWTWLASRRATVGRSDYVTGALALAPAAVISLLVVAAVYAFDDVHHAFVHRPLLKGIVIPLSLLLVAGVPIWAGMLGAGLSNAGRAAPGAQGRARPSFAPLADLPALLGRHERLVAGITLAGVGGAHALSYLAVAIDDLIRYWAVADAWLAGAGYPVTAGTPGHEGFYLVELPVYPLLILAAFAVAGHQYASLHLPLIGANAVLPFLFYALARATGRGRLCSTGVALAVLSWPHYQTYTLGAAQPDALWTAFAAAQLLLALHLIAVTPSRTTDEAPAPTLTPRAARESGPSVSPHPARREGKTAREGTKLVDPSSFVVRPVRSLPFSIPRTLRSGRPAARLWLLFGGVSALSVLTRPEGALYTAPLYVALALAGRRRTKDEGRMLFGPSFPGSDWDRRFASRQPISFIGMYRRVSACIGGFLRRSSLRPARGRRFVRRATSVSGLSLAFAVCAVPVAVYSLFLWHTFGIIWPSGWANVASPGYLLPNLQLILGRNLPYYAESAGLPAPELMGPAAGAALLALVLIGLWRFCRRFPALAVLPVPLALNAGVILCSPTDLAADHLSPPTFLRHLSMTFPWLVPALALALPRRHPLWAALLTLFLVAELSVLGAAAARDQAQQLTVLTSDPYVLATDLFRAGAGLPRLPFAPGPGHGSVIDPAFEYHRYRETLFAAMRPYALHVIDDGRAYTLAATVFSVAGLAALAIARRPTREATAVEPHTRST